MKNKIFFLSLYFILSLSLNAQTGNEPIIWTIDNLTSIGGHDTQVLGDPMIVNDELGLAVEFDGIDDGLIVQDNPLADATEFTVEVVFQPYASSEPDNAEQRFIHMQESDDNRLLIELRLADDNQWFLDTFIKSGDSNMTLFAEAFPHPIGPWYHAALVYKDNEMRHYVNGELEMTGSVNYIPVSGGQTSVGVRLNERSWYRGAIHELRVTHKALEPGEFSLLVTGVEQRIEESRNLRFDLLQNIPNPFNIQTTIQYSIREQSYINLAVYNLLGQRITRLQNGLQPAANYRVIFDASGLQSGVYFYRLQIGHGLVKTKKMILVK